MIPLVNSRRQRQSNLPSDVDNGQVEMGNLTMSRSSGDELHVVVNGFRSANRLATEPPKNSGRALPTRLG